MSGPVAYLLDTNVLSETRKRKANPKVMAFLQTCNPASVFVSVLTIGELRAGLEKKRRKDPVDAQRLEAWIEDTEEKYRENILGINLSTTRLWGEWSSERSRPVVDTLIAATAAHHSLTLVTRNTRDVRGLPITVLNPWLEK